MAEFDAALAELEAERPNWRLSIVGVNQTWFATISEPVPPTGPPSRTFGGEQGTTPAQAIRNALAYARSRQATV